MTKTEWKAQHRAHRLEVQKQDLSEDLVVALWDIYQGDKMTREEQIFIEETILMIFAWRS